jgi:hypothetical protein
MKDILLAMHPMSSPSTSFPAQSYPKPYSHLVPTTILVEREWEEEGVGGRGSGRKREWEEEGGKLYQVHYLKEGGDICVS